MTSSDIYCTTARLSKAAELSCHGRGAALALRKTIAPDLPSRPPHSRAARYSSPYLQWWKPFTRYQNTPSLESSPLLVVKHFDTYSLQRGNTKC
ncbi:hypothetical protein RRG08_001015 [Elysia crispata]|uniref:Uncharacterized protein n=1 Tax=Elysia crispata TaxID=231223 RepID=A0AAE1E584_9GAST|nr:hypothetical protein RRG08_001015 [Elysia crispata]